MTEGDMDVSDILKQTVSTCMQIYKMEENMRSFPHPFLPTAIRT